MTPFTDKTGFLVGASDTHDGIQNIDISRGRGGIHNVRAIEGVQISGMMHIKNGLIIRSANLDSIGQWEAEQLIHRYGVKAIFDLRDEREIRNKSKTTCGIPIYRLSALHAVDPEVVATYFQGLSQNAPSAFASFYMHIERR
ncbi:hypothetical protein N7501_008340 [Penicillium viridicatum]|nr:hypothetical protein N7501_008340 [Penicillium viridicatum]